MNGENKENSQISLAVINSQGVSSALEITFQILVLFMEFKGLYEPFLNESHIHIAVV